MNRLSVGLDVTPLFDHPTGITRFVSGLLGGLASNPSLDVGGWILSARPIDHTRPYAGDAPCRTVRIRTPARIVHRAWVGGLTLGSRQLKRFEVIHGTNFAAPPGPKSVISLHDLTLFESPGLSAPVSGRAALIRRAVSSGCHLIVPTEHVRLLAMETLHVDPAQITTVAYGLTPIPPTTRGAGHARAAMSSYVLALGTVHHRKNLVCLIRAMESMPPNLGLVVAGAAGDDEGTVNRAIDNLKRRRPVRRLADVDDLARAELLRDATLLAYPSLDEGFGFPPLEAMSVGVPVVAGDAGSIPEVVGDGALLTNPSDPDSLAEAMLRAISPEGRSSLLPKGFAVAARYNWACAADKTAAVYRLVSGLDE